MNMGKPTYYVRGGNECWVRNLFSATFGIVSHQHHRVLFEFPCFDKTESVYRRYAIVSDADLQEATRKFTGTTTGTTPTSPLDPSGQVCEKTAGLA